MPGHILFRHDGTRFGGICTHTLDLARGLAARGWRVTISTPPVPQGQEDKVGEAFSAAGFPVVQLALSGSASPVRLFSNLQKLHRFLSGERVDIFHIQRSSPYFSKWTILAARLAGCPLIVSTDHDPPYTTRLWHHLLNEGVNSLLDGVIVVSRCAQRLRQEVIRQPRGRIHQVYNGIDTQAYVPAAPEQRAALRRKFGLEPDTLVVGDIGRVSSIKGMIDLVNAMPLLLERFPGLVLLIAGDGVQKPELEERSRQLGLLGRQIRFAGFVPDVAEFMQILDIFITPSHNEGFGLVAAEAMACGVPVIATTVGGLPEVVSDGETGLLVPEDDPAAIARSAARLLEDPALRRRMGNASRLRVENLFTYDRMVENTIAVYNSLKKK